MADYEVWKREEGYWYGEYTFLGAEGDPYVSSSWNYPYDHYYGFIHIELNGNALKQRNVFIYPPQTAEKCEADDSRSAPRTRSSRRTSAPGSLAAPQARRARSTSASTSELLPFPLLPTTIPLPTTTTHVHYRVRLTRGYLPRALREGAIRAIETRRDDDTYTIL